MNWLNKFWDYVKGKAVDTSPEEGNGQLKSGEKVNVFEGLGSIRFGRYSDNNKSQRKTQQWYAAEDRFKEKNYTAAFVAFFDYLRDEAEDNVHVEQDGDNFQFTICQGSKKVHGEIKDGQITARVPLVVMETPRTAVMRRLLEMNYSLYYSHSGMDEGNKLYMVFLSDVAATNPSKLYYGLRELATKADRQDDLLIADFPSLNPTDSEHVQQLPDWEVDVKYKYFRKWTEQALGRVAELNQDAFSGAIAYLLLDLIYKIDFLIHPESKLLVELEKINGLYWDKKDEVALVERNQMMKDAIKKLLRLSRDEFAASLHRSKSAFSIATPPKADKVRDHIISANKDSRWYVENKYPDIALVINEYGLLYNQFIYSMPRVQTDLITIYMAVMHPDYFAELGMKHQLYDPKEATFNIDLIQDAIDTAIGRFRDKFKNLKWDHKRISWENRYEFGLDFTEYLSNLNLETKRD